MLTDKLISDADWLSVYKESRVKGKVKLKHVQPECYDACMTLHQKVHQEIPVNNELSVSFASEHCKSAKEENNLEMYRVAWAIAGEASVERCRKMGSLQQKVIRFWSMVVDDATVDSQQIPQETPHRRQGKCQ